MPQKDKILKKLKEKEKDRQIRFWHKTLHQTAPPFFFSFFRFVNVFAQPHKDQKQEDSIYRRRVVNDSR